MLMLHLTTIIMTLTSTPTHPHPHTHIHVHTHIHTHTHFHTHAHEWYASPVQNALLRVHFWGSVYYKLKSFSEGIFKGFL